MSSITTAVAADYRLQQWAQLVKECQNRPSDMTEEQWCDTRGISKSNYYYRLHRIRKACLGNISRKILFHASRLLRFLKTLCICQKVLPISQSRSWDMVWSAWKAFWRMGIIWRWTVYNRIYREFHSVSYLLLRVYLHQIYVQKSMICISQEKRFQRLWNSQVFPEHRFIPICLTQREFIMQQR